MRILSFTFVITLTCHLCFGQNTQKLDSLKQALTISKSDTARVWIYMELMNAAGWNERIGFGLLGFNLAKEINYNKGIVRCGNKVAFAMVSTDFYKAIPIALETKQIAESINDKEELVFALGTLGYAYGKFDHKKAFSYYMRAKSIIDKEGFSEDLMNISLLIGMWYKDENKHLDSALYYLNKSYQLALNSKAYFYRPQNHLRHFGHVYYNLGQKDKAMSYFREVIATFNANSYSYKYMAYIFRDRNQLDSAKYYAEKSFEMVKNSASELSIVGPATLLYELYEHTNPAQALQYHLIASSAKDSIFNQDKARQVDKLAFEVQEREAMIQRRIEADQMAYQTQVKIYALLSGLLGLSVLAFMLYKNNKNKQKANTLLKEQKEEIESTLEKLKSTQSQLIQSEKMASLGELTAGIAHEIQNPLNFVNNFAEVSSEMIEELFEERTKEKGERDQELEEEILDDIVQNLIKINHHGQRASGIVKGMLEHSRTSTGKRELTDINVLADEYLRLAYHGLRAKNKSFNADFKMEFDETLPKINVVSQDIGRVLLNLINNAFYTVDKKAKLGIEGFKPEVKITTEKVNDKVVIKVWDNGEGIPEQVQNKIFQPFFTTKPTGSGTGLGLSLAYDIVTKGHGGHLEVETEEGKGAEFKIILPVV